MAAAEEKKNMTNFIHFGCWNNLNETGNLKPVMTKLRKMILERKTSSLPEIDFISVAGDNYYPDKPDKQKDKDKTKTKTKGAPKDKKDKKNKKNKRKLVYPQHIETGFNMLPKNIDIHMIIGNHDLETNLDPTKPTLFVKDTENADTEAVDNPEVGCKIITTQQNQAATNSRIMYTLHDDRVLTNDTLVLMIDTSMYTMDYKKYLTCYNIFLKEDHTIETLMDKQLNFIVKKLKENSNIKNLILIGHHPITGVKIKENTVTHLKDIPRFMSVLTIIYNTLQKDVNYYYLCADLHIYQEGIIRLDMPAPNDSLLMNESKSASDTPNTSDMSSANDEFKDTSPDTKKSREESSNMELFVTPDNPSPDKKTYATNEPLEERTPILNQMVINQYVVGTGGTELDDDVSSVGKNYSFNIRYDLLDNVHYNLYYEMTNSIHSNGFLECNVTPEGIVFNFHPLTSVAGKKTRKRKKTRNKSHKPKKSGKTRRKTKRGRFKRKTIRI